MNLRQKCKKLKKENERLQKYIPGYPSPIVHVDHYQMVTLAARKELNPKYETLNYYQDLMKSYLLEDVTDDVKKFVRTEQYRDMTTGRIVIEGRVKVCEPD